MMTLNELIRALEDFRDSFDGDPEVKVALQPNWPLAAPIRVATKIGDTLWLATGAATEYAPSKAWEGGEFNSDADEEDEED